MGLSNFPSPAEGVLPVLILSVALLKNMVRSVLQLMGVGESPPNLEEYDVNDACPPSFWESARDRRISVTLYMYLCNNRSSGRGECSFWSSMECCVCLCGFQANEEVSELPCKHFFHKCCLQKWLDHNHTTCPLCRSPL
ncbi:PREDICTED: probable E3 ubiquitin-protein ligase XERICO [Nelumbo nucifera]|uniref:RING-type domain-containing protein n=2 Tax=Nelumbo nucifera TaxID=4432 RepID=A0A822YJS0_NELNU|nr:PREDICTED: probable E3 ubiquitin-protein ligase XERICO [Nelumbo nucifera]DAD34434.1 TPA_asm: hypothetical protein HUJ06_005075 [Nelumbo nucifera]